MDAIFNFFNQGWVGSVIGVIGVIFGVIGMFSYKFSRSTAKPSYQKSSLRLLGRKEDNLPDDVSVLFKGTEVERLTKTTIVIWNNGTEVLSGEDIVESDLLRFSFPEGSNILSFNVIKNTRDTNEFSLSKDENRNNELVINFSYLDPKDGATIEILHDSENRHPEIIGTIKGLPKGVEDLGRVYSNKPMNVKPPFNFIFPNRKLVFWTAIIMGLSLFILGVLPDGIVEIAVNEKATEDKGSVKIAFIITGALYTLLPASMLWYRREKYPKALKVDEIEP